MRKLYKYFLFSFLFIIFIYCFKIACDNWNKDAIEHNRKMKEYCPCEKWHYVSRGQWECDCNKNEKMKISKIEKKDGLYYVTKTPNFIQKLFGMKENVERYKCNGEVFHYFNHVKVFYKSTGEIVSWSDKMCNVLNNYDRSF